MVVLWAGKPHVTYSIFRDSMASTHDANTSEAPAVCPGCGRPSTVSYSFDARRWSWPEWITGAASVVLLVSLFRLWVFLNQGGGTGFDQGDAISAHGYLWGFSRWRWRSSSSC